MYADSEGRAAVISSGIDQIFWLAEFFGELTLIAVLLHRREFRSFPIFLSYVGATLVEGPVLFWVFHHSSEHNYLRTYVVTSVIDDVLQLGLLIEIAYAVLLPDHRSWRRAVLAGIAFCLLLGISISCLLSFSGNSSPAGYKAVFGTLQTVNFIFSYTRLGLFAAIAAFSQMLGITWRNHVIRLAAGLAFYSAVSVVVQLSLSHLAAGNHVLYTNSYYLLQRIQVIGYLMALAFWVWSFLQKDAPRKEFTPQMQRILVTISQAAHRDRVNLTRGLGNK